VKKTSGLRRASFPEKRQSMGMGAVCQKKGKQGVLQAAEKEKSRSQNGTRPTKRKSDVGGNYRKGKKGNIIKRGVKSIRTKLGKASLGRAWRGGTMMDL